MSRVGRPAPAADHSAGKQWIALVRHRERAQLQSALKRFAGRGPLLLSDLASLDTAELDLLLSLLDEALSSPRSHDGTRSTRTSDGRLAVIVRLPEREGAHVVLRTPMGILRCLDYQITVTENTPASSLYSEEASDGGSSRIASSPVREAV